MGKKMNYFKNEENKIFAYDDEQVKNGCGSDLIAITEAEKDEILKPKGANLIALNIANAKAARDSAISSNLESNNYLWQVRDSDDLQNIQDGIDEAEYNNYPEDRTISYRMADNTWQDITVNDLRKVKSDYRLRKLDVFSKFKTWTEADMLTPFEV